MTPYEEEDAFGPVPDTFPGTGPLSLESKIRQRAFRGPERVVRAVRL